MKKPQITQSEAEKRNKIMIHCADHERTVIEEYHLILEKKSEMSRADRDYLVDQVAKSQDREVKRQVNLKRRINNLK